MLGLCLAYIEYPNIIKESRRVLIGLESDDWYSNLFEMLIDDNNTILIGI